jgi:hypothetical protein
VLRARVSIVSECFYSGDVFESLSLWIEKGLVDSEVMGISVNVGDRLAECDDKVSQREQVVFVFV